MRCYKHADREGTGTCEICGKTLCDECQIHLGNQVICKSCVASLIPDNDPQDMVNKAKDEKQKNEDKPKKSLFGFLKRNKEENKEKEQKPKRTQSTVNQYPYGEVNNPYHEDVIHEETYDYWDEDENLKTPEPEFAYQDQSPLFKSDEYATQSEKPKSHRSIFRRHKMEKPEKKLQNEFEGYVASEEIVIDHSDDEPSQLETLFIENEEPELTYDSYYDEEKKIVDEFKAQAKESEAPQLNSIIIDHTDDESSQIKDYNPQYEEPSLKEEMENIIDRSNEIIIEEQTSDTALTNDIPKNNNDTQTGGETVTQLSKEEIEDLIYQLHKEGNSPSKIGIILRDQYNVPNIKAATGQKLTKIIKSKEELENPNNIDSEEMSIASAEVSSVINTESDEDDLEKSRPSLKPFDDINGPQVFNYEDGAPVKETEDKVVENPEVPVQKETVPEPIKEESNETDTGEIIIEKTPEEIELLKKIEKETPVEIENPTITKPKVTSTTAASSKVEPIPVIPKTKTNIPNNVIAMQSIIDSSMFVKSYVDNYSMLPSSVRIEHKKWNMAEYLYYSVTSIVNISQGIGDPIQMKSLIDVLHTKEDFKFGTITKEDYLFLARIIQSYIDSEGRAPFNRQSTIGVLQFRTLVYLFASVLTTYKFTNQLPETYLVNDNVFRTEDEDRNEYKPKEKSQQVIPPVPTPSAVSAQTPEPEPTITPKTTEPQISNVENAPKNLIDELHKNIQDYKNQKYMDSPEIPSEPTEPEPEEYLVEEPHIDNGIERTSVPIPEPEPEVPQDEIITPKKDENPSVSNIKRLMHNSSKNSQIDEEDEVQHTIEELEKTKDSGVGNLKENYIDNRTRELKENPHKLTRSAQSPMPKPKEVIRGKKELIKEDLKYTPNNEKIRPNFEEDEYYADNNYEEEDYTEMGDWLIFLISFIIFLVVFGAIAYIIYVTYFQATFGTPGELISSLLKAI